MKSLLDKINAKLNAQGGFLKAVSVLVGGTAFAQVLGVLTLPIITRLYTPDEFSLFAMYTSILAIITVIGCLRYEIAIPIPENNNKALALVKISFISLMLVLSVLILSIIIINFLDFPFEFKKWIWIIPLSAFFICLFNILQYWFVRNKEFKHIANIKIKQSSLVVVAQIFGGYFQISGGLILGALVGSIFGVFNHLRKFLSKNNKIIYQPVKSVAYEYKKFPLLSTFESLFNNGAVYLPLIIIGIYLEKKELALAFLAIKVLGLPISLIGTAISQVYLSNAAEVARKAKLTSFTNNIVMRLAIILIVPFIAILLLAPSFSVVIFGSEWVGIGQFIVLMLPWFYFQLISSPVSSSLHITNNQQAALFLQIFGFVLRFGGVYLLCILEKNSLVIKYYALSGAVFYCTYFFVIQYFIKLSDREMVIINEY